MFSRIIRRINKMGLELPVFFIVPFSSGVSPELSLVNPLDSFPLSSAGLLNDELLFLSGKVRNVPTLAATDFGTEASEVMEALVETLE